MSDIDWISRLQEDFGESDEKDEAPQNRPANVTQHTLLSYLASNFDAWAIVEPMIKPEYFDEEYRKVVQQLIDHTLEYKQIPSRLVIRMKTGVLLDEPGDAEDERTTQWLLDEMQTFCRHRATEIEIKRAAQAMQNDPTTDTIEQIFQNFKTITEISLEKDLGIEIHRDARKMLSTRDDEMIKRTGYAHLDQITHGGFPCPGSIMFVGTSGIGKSVLLANFGVQYCLQGDFVVYVTLELPERRVFDRVCSIMTDTAIRNIWSERDHVSQTMEYRIESEGLFRIKKMKMSGTTTAHVHAYLKELYMKEGKRPNVVILDYLDLLHPRARLRDLSNIHAKDKYCAEELYALFEEWKVLGLTASQKVKNNSDLDEFDHASISGGTPKINIQDYALSLRRKEEELWMQVMKGRYGGDGTQIPFHWDENTLKISDGADALFWEKNPRFDPKYKRESGLKTSTQLRKEINRDTRAVKNDNILETIKSMSHEFE